MQYIWLFLTTASFCLLLFSSPDKVIVSMLTATQNALELSLSLAGIYCLWLGVINVAKNCGLVDNLSQKTKPLLKKLFGTNNDKICDNLSLNLSANLLGVSNASTPPALNAIKQMDRGDGKLTKGMAMLFVINCCGLQLLPTTVIGIRASLGSANPSDVILPCLVTSLVTTAVGILLVNLCFGAKK